MQQPQQVQTHHQVVEEILPDQMSDEVTKEVINQFLPQRKRKPRQPKGPGKQQKIIKLEPQAGTSMEQTVHVTTVEQGMVAEPGSEMIVEEQEQEQIGGELVEQVVGEGEEESKQNIKEESMDQSSAAGGSPSKTPKTPKDKAARKFMITNRLMLIFKNRI